MKIELSDTALEWQAIARTYADEYLQPHEIEAELNEGVIRKDITKRNKQRAIELGFSAIDVPKAYGGLELSLEEQVAIWEQLGRVTNALSANSQVAVRASGLPFVVRSLRVSIMWIASVSVSSSFAPSSCEANSTSPPP